MGFGEVVSFSIMKVSECVWVLTLISWDKNTECLGHCQVFVREKLLEGRRPFLLATTSVARAL